MNKGKLYICALIGLALIAVPAMAVADPCHGDCSTGQSCEVTGTHWTEWTNGGCHGQGVCEEQCAPGMGSGCDYFTHTEHHHLISDYGCVVDTCPGDFTCTDPFVCQEGVCVFTCEKGDYANHGECVSACQSGNGQSCTETCAACGECTQDSDCLGTEYCALDSSCQVVQCDDQDACTADVVTEHTCQNTPLTCDDQNPCTTDTCDPVSGCVFTDILGCTGQLCTNNNDCADGNWCTANTCPDGVCITMPYSGVCNDGNQCTTGDSCATGVCTGNPLTCENEGQTCNPQTGFCEGAYCGEGICNGDETCDSCPGDCGECLPVDPCASVQCEEGFHCEARGEVGECILNPQLGCPEVPCPDGQVCVEGQCVILPRAPAGECCYTDKIFGALELLSCGGLGDANSIDLDSVDGEPLYVTVTHWGGSFSCELTEHQGESEYSYADTCEAVDYYHNSCDVQRLCVGTVASFTTTGSRDFRIKCAPNNINDDQPFSIQVIDHFVDYSGISDGRVLDLHFMRAPDLQGCR